MAVFYVPGRGGDMAYLEWSDDLRVGVRDVDEQHQRLVSMINDLHTAMQEGRGKDILGPTIAGLLDYTVVHFATEERYFDTYEYGDAADHKSQHQGFIEQVDDFRQGFTEDRLMLSIDVMDFLSTWLVEHIKGSDRAFGPFLNEHGVN
jgi:hemerythrin